MSTKMNRKSCLLGGTSQAVEASATKQVVSEVVNSVSEADSMIVQVMIEVSGYSGTVTGILQDSHDGDTWNDVKTVTIDDDGQFEIVNNVYNGTDEPTWNQLRVAITTAAASAVTVDEVTISKR